ncbi:MAG: class I SAM-dependent methyltransferase [Sphingomonadales bacterium]|nr:class I SAM-dependent methyltransferase [Sphingomonadales bacterium]
MNFEDPRVAAVFARYAAREVADAARMRELGPAGFAVRDEFLLPVGPEVGAFLHALILAKRPRRILELGTSYGYSTLFLADAARSVGAQVVTMELADYKQRFAREQLSEAGLADVVDFRLGDAVAMIAEDAGEWDMILLDIWKELYVPCLDAFLPHLADEGIICADNIVQPVFSRPEMRLYRAAVEACPQLRTTLLPIGSGIELSVRWSADNPKL